MKKDRKIVMISLIYNYLLIGIVSVAILINKYAGFMSALIFGVVMIFLLVAAILFIIVWYMTN